MVYVYVYILLPSELLKTETWVPFLRYFCSVQEKLKLLLKHFENKNRSIVSSYQNIFYYHCFNVQFNKIHNLETILMFCKIMGENIYQWIHLKPQLIHYSPNAVVHFYPYKNNLHNQLLLIFFCIPLKWFQINITTLTSTCHATYAIFRGKFYLKSLELLLIYKGQKNQRTYLFHQKVLYYQKYQYQKRYDVL